MLSDDDAFSSKAKVDRYGRKLPKSQGRKELEKYYRIEDHLEEGVGEGEGEGEGEGPVDDEEVEKELKRLDAGIEEDDEEGGEESSEDSESSSDEDEADLDEEEQTEVFGILEEQGEDGEGIPKGEVSSRLAVVNLDWDNIRATDLMAVFSSFVPGSGRILKIAVYPSEFGRERMEREEMEGPPKEIFGSSKKSERIEEEEDDDNESGSSEDLDEDEDEDPEDDEDIKKSILKEDAGLEFNSAKLRRYQLERLRYYYAVLTCSSTSVAQAIYDAVDGTEYLTTANFFDLRYIPDDTTFEDDKPRDECDRIPDGYRPNEFVTDALQHSKVRLTWDADDGARKEMQKRAFGGSRKDIDDNDLRAYLGSDSEEEEDDDDGKPEPIIVDATATNIPAADEEHIGAEKLAPKLTKKEAERQRTRALLGLSAEPIARKSKAAKDAPVGDMQVTFTSGLSASADGGKKSSVFENEPERDETTVEKYVRKEKERKARRKEKMKNKGADGDGDGDDEDPGETPAAAGDAGEGVEDQGFDDAFFTSTANPPADTKTSTSKADKRAKREARAAEETASAVERTKLEALMADPSKDGEEINHFDIHALARAEKVRGKKAHRKQKLSARDREALAAKEKDGFEMDVGDERFRDVFERSDFAIDPSHPRYKGTEGMRRLLEEGRRKRGDGGGEEEGDDGGSKRGKRRRGEGDDDDDVEGLVKRVKRKSKGVV